MNVVWIDDEAAKVVLQEIGIEAFESDILVTEIDRKASRENRARDIPLDESRIEGIQNAAEKGVPFPKIVVRKKGNTYVICGGNHRFAALEKYHVKKPMPVHMMQCTDAEFEIACRVLNTVVGSGIAKEERIKFAMDAHERLSIPMKAACAMYGVSVEALKRALSNASAHRRLLALSPKSKNRVSMTHITKLGELAKNDNVLRAAAVAIAEKKLTAAVVGELASIARLQPTEAMQVAVFERETARHDDTKSAVPRKIRAKFVAALNSIQSLKDKKTWESVEIKKSEIQTFKDQIRDVQNILNCLCKDDG